jgi:hypothetical protein
MHHMDVNIPAQTQHPLRQSTLPEAETGHRVIRADHDAYHAVLMGVAHDLLRDVLSG